MGGCERTPCTPPGYGPDYVFVFYLRISGHSKEILEFLFVKTTPKLTVMEHAMELKIQILSVLVHVLHTMQNLVISHCCFAGDDKEMYQDL